MLNIIYNYLQIFCQNLKLSIKQKNLKKKNVKKELLFSEQYAIHNDILVKEWRMIRNQKQDKSSIKQIIEGQKNQVYYDCQCGKRYQTFPALYLHFQRRHQQKISTKPDKEYFKVTKNQTNTIITYYIKQTATNQAQDGFLSFYQNFIPKLLIKYRETISITNYDIPKQIVENILQIFKVYLQKHLKKFKQGLKLKDNVKVDEKMFLRYIPHLYNGFISESIGKGICLKDYQYACKFIYKFNTWLCNNKRTDLNIQYIGFGGQLSNSSLQ